jgi:hypothetical protein
MDHRSFRAQLEFSIGFAISRSRDLLRRILKEHAPDDAQQQLAERVVEHLELSGFELERRWSGAQEAPAPGASRDGARRVAPAGCIRFSAARAFISRLAAALSALRVVAASSSASAWRTASARRFSSDFGSWRAHR